MIQRLLTPDRNRRLIWMLVGLVIAFAWVAGRDGRGRDGQACTVEQIQAGDLMAANCAVEGTVTIRLYCLDAANPSQPEGQTSRDYLRRLAPTTVSLRPHDTDGEGRIIGELLGHAGQSLNLALVEGGQATVDPRSCPERRFLAAQERAQQTGRGIWATR